MESVTFGRVVEAAHLHCLGCLARLHFGVWRSNDGDLSYRGVEAGQQPACIAWPLVTHTNTHASDTTLTGRAQVM